MAFPKLKIFTLLIAVFSLVGIILLFADYFGGIYGSFGGFLGQRFSCLAGCEYNTPLDTTAQIIAVVLLAVQLVFAINNVVPKPFLKKLVGMNFITILALLTIVMMAMGAISFGATYADLELWFGAGFYGGLIAGILNMVLAVVASRVK